MRNDPNELSKLSRKAKFIVLVLVICLFFSLPLLLRLPSKWTLLSRVADSDCRFLYESEFGIDTDNSRCSEDLRQRKTFYYALLFDSIWMVDLTNSEASTREIMDFANVVGDSEQVRLFVVSNTQREEIGLDLLMRELREVPLAVEEVKR